MVNLDAFRTSDFEFSVGAKGCCGKRTSEPDRVLDGEALGINGLRDLINFNQR